MTMRFGSLGLGDQSRSGHHIMAHLALERVHRLQRHRLSGGPDTSHGLLRDLRQFDATCGTVAIDVEHETRPIAGTRLHRQTSQFLNGFEHFSITSDEIGQLARIPLFRGDNRNGRPTVINVNIDVSAEIGDIEKFLEVVGADLALLLKTRDGIGRGGVLAHGESVLLNGLGTADQFRRFFF